MKNKIKTLAIILGIIFIILTAISAVFGYTYAENTSEVANTMIDTNKTDAKLDSNLQLDYIARDIATYKNLYCANHGQALDEAVYYYDVYYQAIAMADIKGDTATFYKIENGNFTSVGSVNNSANNVMAGIFTDKVIKDQMNSGKAASDETFIYNGYGGLPMNNPVSYFDRYYSVNTVIQNASHLHFNDWIEATKSYSTKAGFKKEYVNTSILNKKRLATAKTYIDKIKASSQKYNAKIYFLVCVGDTEGIDIQPLMLVEAEEKINIPVTKIWNDNNNSNNNRPSSITVKLLANNADTGKTLTLNANGGWAGTFADLNKNDNSGNEISYTIQEVSVTGYTSTITGNQTSGFRISNTLQTTSIPAKKTWNDDNNRDGKRPSAVTVELWKNVNGASSRVTTTTLSGNNGWAYTFTNLPKYQSAKLITYTVKETAVSGYTATEGNSSNSYTITNTHTPEKTSVPVTKVWNDDNNRDGIRPSSITVTLYANGQSTGQTATLTSSNWTHTFTNLYKYQNGQVITYTVKEASVSGYTGTEGNSSNGYKITNTHTPERTSITVRKQWNDDNNRDGKRPTSITVTLYANGQSTGQTATLTSNNWAYTFTNLYKYQSGQTITYTVKETAVSGYTGTEGNSSNNYTITNTHIPERTSITVNKQWNDENNRDGIRPTAITVTLYANGQSTGKTATITSSNWKYTFANLYKYQNGQVITYTVRETAVSGYTATEGNSSNNYTITNTHIPEKIDIPIRKVWDDESNRDGIRPTSITVTLYANGTKVTKDGNGNSIQNPITVTGTGNTWTAIFRNLYKYENGRQINYTVQENSISKYETPIMGGNSASGLSITNKHIPEVTQLKVTKKWNDDNDLDEYRPNSIKVTLYANGTPVTRDAKGNAIENPKTISASNNWGYTFNNLYKYENGKEINYTIQEDKVDNYNQPAYAKTVQAATSNSPQVINYVITNTHIPYYDGYIEITGKVWNDGKGAKANEINGTYGDSWDKGIAGVKVTLKNSNGAPFKATYYHKNNNGNLIKDGTDYAITSDNGEYVIRVNYDNRQNVYKLYENSATVKTNLNTSYIDFEYNGIKYTTVANASKEAAHTNSSAKKSKAIENVTERSNIDSKYSTVTSGTNTNSWESVKLTATTKNLISFETYKDKTTTNRAEVVKYCNGNGTYTQTNPEQAWASTRTGNCDSLNHSATCSGKGHSLRTYNVEVEIIQNVNLGLFERENPDVAIFEELQNINLKIKDSTYKYEYKHKTTVEETNKDNVYNQSIREGATEQEAMMKAKFQQKGGYEYELPIDPADIAYAQTTGDFSVIVEYECEIANLSSTLNMEVDKVLNTFDSRYEVIGVKVYIKKL